MGKASRSKVLRRVIGAGVDQRRSLRRCGVDHFWVEVTYDDGDLEVIHCATYRQASLFVSEVSPAFARLEPSIQGRSDVPLMEGVAGVELLDADGRVLYTSDRLHDMGVSMPLHVMAPGRYEWSEAADGMVLIAPAGPAGVRHGLA